MTTRQRTCLSAFVGMVEELSKWTSQEVAHSLPAKDRPSTLPARVVGASVTFEPGARTAWHSLVAVPDPDCDGWLWPGPTLGGPIEDIRPGDVIWFPPGEKHWHGSAPTTAMTHIAIQERLDDKTVDWMEQESSEQYQA